MKKPIKPVKEARWAYHDGDVSIVARKIERFTSGDLQIIGAYLHANDSPTIQGLAEYAKTCV